MANPAGAAITSYSRVRLLSIRGLGHVNVCQELYHDLVF